MFGLVVYRRGFKNTLANKSTEFSSFKKERTPLKHARRKMRTTIMQTTVSIRNYLLRRLTSYFGVASAAAFFLASAAAAFWAFVILEASPPV